MIRVTDISVQLGHRTVVDRLSLNLQPGRVTVILGPNGAGKTSLIRALAGLIAPSQGGIMVDDTPLHQMRSEDRAQRIGYLPQNGTPAWAVTVRDLVALGRLPHIGRFAGPTATDEAAIHRALVDADLLALADRSVDTLSGGERARAKFARVLAGETDWILADEPLANLDPPHQRDTLRLLRSAAQAGKGVLAVLHQLNAAVRLADDVLLMKEGRAVAFGPAKQTLTPANLAATFGMEMDVIELDDRTAILPR